MKLHPNLSLALLAVSLSMPAIALAQTAQVHVRAPQAQAEPVKDPQRFDTKLPVEITSDSLEVLQHENKAVFKGNVVAVQGTVRLKADEMIVHYKQGGKQPATTPPPPATGDTGSMGAISNIEVIGHVLVATPEESAQGDKGNYDVPTRQLFLTGGNVILTRNKNIIRGTDLVYNMETGKSTLINTGNSTGKRVHGIFVPNQMPSGNGDKPAHP